MSTHSTTFTQRFLKRSQHFGSVCVGIDPHDTLMQSWGLEGSPAGLAEFSRRCVDAFAPTACVVKPQVAFFERYGSAGYAVLEDTIAALRSNGVLVIADAKRGDIGSTMAGYASAWLDDSSPLCVDAVTVSAYLGFGSLAPVLEQAERTNRGVLVLAATSNPEAHSVQQARILPEAATATARGAGTVETAGDAQGDRADSGYAPEVSIAQDMVNKVADFNARHAQSDGHGTGNIGVVVGATVPNPPDLQHVAGMILMPGVGAQGGTFDDIKRIAGTSVGLVCPHVSRGVLSHGPDIDALSSAVVRLRGDFLK